MILFYAYLLLGVAAVQIVWQITDSRPITDRLRSHTPLRFSIVYGIPATQLISHLYFPMPTTLLTVALIPIGFIIFTAGVVLCIWGRFNNITSQKHLATTGPYIFTRNPIYLGLIMLTFGLSIALSSWLFFLTYLTYFYFDTMIKKEEILLKKHFRKAYQDYCKRVPRYL